MIETLAQVTADASGNNKQGFCCGIVLWDDKVVEAAPPIHYMKRWSRDRVRAYCQSRAWKIVVVWQMERQNPYKVEPHRGKDMT